MDDTGNTLLEEHPELLGKAFREDFDKLAKTSEDRVIAIGNWLKSRTKYTDLADEKQLVIFSASIGELIEQVNDYLRPIKYIARVCADEEVNASDVIEQLALARVFPTGSESFLHTFTEMVQVVSDLVAEALEEATIHPPLPRIRSMRTRCVSVYEFNNEFSAKKDDPETYLPEMRRQYPTVTWELEFRDNEHKPISISLSEKDLDDVIKWLSLARVQLRTVARSIEQDRGERDTKETSDEF